MYDAIIIGGGVIGCAIARELSRFRLNICLLEREEDVCTGTSKANSAIVHAGFDAKPGSYKALFNVRGNEMMEPLCRDLDIPYHRCGSLVLSFDQADRPQLEALLQRGIDNGVEELELVEREALHAMEPNLSENAVAALYAPTGGIVCPFTLTYALAENAAANGVVFRFDTCVERIEATEDGFAVYTNNGTFESRTVINAAGVYADELHNQVCENKLRIVARRGEYCLLDKTEGNLVSRTIFQLPSAMGKGVLVTPTVHGNLLVGPTAADQEGRDDTATTAEGLAQATSMAALSVARLPMNRVITAFAGLRAHIAEGADDFVIGQSADGFFDAAGIESPGLTSAPAIGRYVAGELAAALSLAKKESFEAKRRPAHFFSELTQEEKCAYIKDHPDYGRIVCRCEGISLGEIRDAVRTAPRAETVDAVKRRTRAGMGRCQGGFCQPVVVRVLSEELGIPYEQVTKSGGDSHINVERIK